MSQCLISQSRFLRHAGVCRAYSRKIGGGWIRRRLVVTQPDRPKGRGMELAPSPVKQRALQLGLAGQPAGQDQEQ